MELKRLLSLLAAMLLCCIAADPRLVQAGVGGCRCVPAGGTTADHWGSGATCGEAAADWKSQVWAEEQAECMPYGVCQMTPPYVVNTPCYWDEATQTYRENGEGRFRCQVCFD